MHSPDVPLRGSSGSLCRSPSLGCVVRVELVAQRGFTLLELLIAMTLVALIMAAVFNGLRMGARSWEAGDKRARASEEIRLVLGLVARELRQAHSVSRFVAGEGTVLQFEGEEQRLRFVAPMLEYLGVGGLYWIGLELEDIDGEPYLVMRWRPYRTEMEEEFTPEDEFSQLTGPVDRLQLQYFGSEQPGREPGWHEIWENSNEMPALIRMSVSVDGDAWPELTVAPPVTALRGTSPFRRRLRRADG
jgi:general secretion pathway protein J